MSTTPPQTSTSNTATTTKATAMRADELLVETIESLFGDTCTPERIGAAEGSMDQSLWKVLEESGLTLVGVSETDGGSGGSRHDASALIRASGYHAAPVPLADTLISARVLSSVGIAIPAGTLALAICRPGYETVGIPYAGVASHVVVVSEGRTALVDAEALSGATRATNYAGEPSLSITQSEIANLASFAPAAQPKGDVELVLALAALGRAEALAGALQRTLDLCVQYANEREQFGKPIGKFQILQHYLSEIAGEAAAAGGAVDNAVDILVTSNDRADHLAVCAAAKAYAGRAVTTVARLSHQLHGAIGYTDEHRLQYTTRRLWAWRDEFGSESEWATQLGRSVCEQGGAALWPRITTWPSPVAS
jgi:acyl-CoA dehydrogenase